MYRIERQSEILKLLEQKGSVEVKELSTLFNSSRETIRRDLGEMAEKGLLKRTHGGAVFNRALASTTPEFPVGVREMQHFKEKNAICRSAAAFINDGDILFVDNSSTCLYLLQYIPVDIQVTLITNSIKLLLGLLELKRSNLTAVCLGGFFHASNLSTYGAMAQKNGADFYPNKAFMSCAGVHLPDRLTDASILEVDTKRLMIERAQEVFILADHSKFERSGPVFLANFSAIHYLITDLKAEPAQLAPLEKAGIKIVRAG